MKIPNDTGHPWRLNKYVEYNKKVPPIGPRTYVFWAEKLNLDPDYCVMLGWFNSMAYCELTAFLLFQELDYKTVKLIDIKKFWGSYKEKLLFNSARMYVKNLDWFVPLMNNFMSEIKRQPFKWLNYIVREGNTPSDRYRLLYKHLMKWKFMGRFSVELFMESMIYFSNKGLLGNLTFKTPDFDWKHGSNITSGVLTIFYEDRLAEEYDKYRTMTPELIEYLDKKIAKIQKAIGKKYPEDDLNISVITPKLCSFRNLFRGTRYGGFHHDRQLQQLIHYEEKCKEQSSIWRNVYRLRRAVHDPILLGEVGGWTGIRKERKKLFLEEGLTGVENVSKY